MLTNQLLKAIGDLVLKVAPDGSRVEYVGPREFFDLPPQSFIDKSFYDLVPREVRDAARECFQSVAATGTARTLEYALPSSSGSMHDCEALVVRSDGGNLLVILRDVHGRKMAERKAQESEQRFRIMADHAPAMLWMSGTSGDCEFFNKGWLDFTGRSLGQELGAGWAEGIHFEDFQHCMSIYLESFVARRGFRMEYRLRNAKGEYRWLLDTGVPRYNPDGTFAGFIGSCIDITESKLAEQRTRQHTETLAASLQERDELLEVLEKRTRALSRSNSELEQFVYAASHDLRAPLRAIQMLSEWIEADLAAIEKPDVSNQLVLLRKRVARMTGLLDDLLEYSRVGREKHVLRQVNTRQLVDEVVETISLSDGFSLEVPDEMPTLETSAAALKQVFSNLLSNAVTHHDRSRGVIRLTADERGDLWEFAVSDDGPGIAPKFQDRVFQVFQTLQPRDRIEGSGLGLALVKKAVESAGGKVSLHSEGRGCTFRFTWPKTWPTDN
jgi:PAS domain S-box-containing protein